MKITTEIFEIPGAPLEGVNPLPKFRTRKPAKIKADENFPDFLKTDGAYQTKVLPYLTQDRYSRKRDLLKLKSVVLENDYLSARFLPELGGRLHSLYDKTLKRELLFTNPVIQPGNLAIRNAWLSGGIEWNIGTFGHTYTTCDNVFSAILQDGVGNDFLRIYEFERNKSIFWQVDFHLPDTSRELICHVRMVNPFPKATTTYWWSNIAVPTDTKTRVLASNKKVISFFRGECKYETLPYIDAVPGIDVTYPHNAPRAFDYFIQKDKDGESTWEAAAYDGGELFFERSTAPLYYKKLFVWGNHRAGRHWQEFLSDGIGTGYYAELQAGIAPSQLHDKLLPANSKYEWTQCFGGLKLEDARLFDEDYNAAVAYTDKNISERVSAEDIAAIDERLTRLADIPVTRESLYNLGTGFGALEIKRMAKDGDGVAPSSMYFPEELIGECEKPWLELLENGTLNSDVRKLPKSYMVSEKWLPRIKACAEQGDSALSYLHLGVAAYEYQRTDVTLTSVYNEEEDKVQIAFARDCFEKSLKLAESVSAYRNLALIAELHEDYAAAEEYYDRAMSLPEAFDDFALSSEYLIYLLKREKYEKLWNIYEQLPEFVKGVDRVKISAAAAAVKLSKFDYMEKFFSEEHYDIREGEVALTDMWFEFCARKMAKERGITDLTPEKLDELIDEAWDNCPPDYSIDFRMSYNRQNKYRIN